jgi:5-methylcytosine-specific restriction endonuclease McrA
MTRSEAKAAGLIRYTDGKICPKSHFPTIRQASNGACLACAKEYAARIRTADPERPKKAKSTYKALHPERILQHARETYGRRKDAMNAKHREWQAKNPHKRREHEATRRAKKSGDNERYTAADIESLMNHQRSRCVYCRQSIKTKFHVDHILPLSKGGTNGKRNIQLLCQPCNQTKHARHPIDFAQSRGLLI